MTRAHPPGPAPAAPADHVPAGWFLLRAPTLPFEVLTHWGDGPGDEAPRPPGPDTPRRRLHALLLRPDIREAIFLASPAVEAQIAPGTADAAPDSPADKLEAAWVRYLERMCWRTTPFGLFAGVAVGTIGTATHLVLAGPERRGRLTRIDSALLHAVYRSLVCDPQVRAALVYRVTDHLYLRGSDAVFVGPRAAGAGHRVRTVPRTAALDHVLARAAHGATPGQLADGLCAAGLAPDAAVAAHFVDALIDAGALVDPLKPPVVGGDGLTHLVERLPAVPVADQVRRALVAVRAALGELDATLAPRSPGDYHRAAAALDALPVAARPAQPFHVVLRHAATELVLDRRVTREVLRGAAALCALAPAAADPLSRFTQALAARYGEREVALLEALDEVAGIGFDPQASTTAELPALLRGLAPPARPPEVAAAWGPREHWLFPRVIAAARAGHVEIAISDPELRALPGPVAPLPDAFSATVSLHAESAAAVRENRYRVHLRRVLGPSGASLFGRFCAGDPALTAEVRALAKREAELAPGAIVAELVHTPHPASGNVMSRPALRRYEIAVLGGSCSTDVTRIALDDLRISVVDGVVQLRSQTLGRRVLPRLSCADNIQLSGVPAYRLLASIARAEGATSLLWDWGALADLADLPRVVHGRCILALARWRLDPTTLAAIAAASGAARQAAIDRLRRERRIPRWTMLCRRDLNLPVDWDNPLSVDAFLAICDGDVVLEEMFPGPGGPFVDGPDGRYAAELVIPFLRQRPRDVPSPVQAAPEAPPGPRAVRPGGEWLYAKIYCSERAADQVLRDVVVPLVTEHAGAFERWFFVRYGDPDWHLRLRFRGQPAVLLGELMPALERLLGQIDRERRVHRVALDTYDPEWERYGGAGAMPVVEALFHHDSDAALGIALAYPSDAEARWQLALRGMYSAIVLLVPDAAERVRIAGAARARYAAQFGLTGRAGRVLGQRFRAEQPRIAEALHELPGAHPLRLGGDLLAERDRRWQPLVSALWPRLPRTVDRVAHDALRARIVTSLVHMHANRVLATDHRLQEALLCGFLERVFGTELAAAARPGSPGSERFEPLPHVAAERPSQRPFP